MAKSENQGLKILYLHDILMEETDEKNPLTVQQLIEKLEKKGISAERKSIYRDLLLLSEHYGLDLISTVGRTPAWFVGERSVELPELKLLVDAVQSSRFLTEKKSNLLIKKLESFCSRGNARDLNRQIFVSGRVKTMNESIYYNVDELHSALTAQHCIKFHYFDYNVQKKKVLRRNGDWYQVYPLGLIYNDGNYYLVAYHLELATIRHYRVDKMEKIQQVEETFAQKNEMPDFHLADYAQQHFGMFSGEKCTVTLRCPNHLSSVIVDRFGLDVIMMPQLGTDEFTVHLPVVLSQQFYGWVFGLGEEVSITAPQEAVEGYYNQLQATLQRGKHT